MNTFTKIFLDGTIITFGLAFLLLISGHEVLAVALILLSPFPCPSGLPC
jgi:hypothetical protein